MSNNKLLMTVLLIFIAVAFYFGSKAGTENKPPVKQANQENTPQKILGIEDPAPDFTLTDIDGNVFKLSSQKEKAIVLFGVAGWCATCIPEGKILTKLRREYQNKGLEVIGVAFTPGDTPDFLKQFKQLGQIEIPLAVDTDNVAKKYNLTKLETTYIVDKKGKIVYKDEAFTDEATYRGELSKIL